MKREHTYRVRRTAGFTLVELIVVLVMVSVIAGFAVPTFLGFVDDNKAKQCEINRKKVVSYLEDMLVTNPDATLGDVLNTYKKEDGDQDIDKDFTRCPVTGKGYTCVGNTVVCEAHGETTAVKRSDKSVTAKLDNALKEEKQTEAGGGIPEPEGGGSNTLEPNKPDQTEPSEPKLEVEISPNPLTLKVNESWTMSVSIIKQENCPNLQYQWTVPNENLVTYNSLDKGFISLTGKQAGSGTVTCTVTAFGADGKEITAKATAIVTVEELQKIALEVSPTSKSIKEGETTTLTASVSPNVNCDYTWSSDHPEIATVTNENKNTATVTGVTASGDAVTITCTATPKSGQLGISTEAQTATATVRVEERKEVNGREILVVGWDSNIITANLDENQYGLKSYLPEEGTWYSESTAVSIPYNNWHIIIEDDKKGGIYPIRYETETETIYFTVRVVYPITSFSIHTKTYNAYNHTMKIDEQEEVYVNFGPDHTTEKDSIIWQTEDASIATIESSSGTVEGNQCWNKIIAHKAGVVKITAIANTGLYPDLVKSAVCTITVVDPSKISNISANTIRMKVGDIQTIGINHEPDTADMSGVSYKFSGYDTNYIEINDRGEVTAKQNGHTTVTIQAVKGEEVQAECTIDVIVTDLQYIWADPNQLLMSVNESQYQTVHIKSEPQTADMTEIRYELGYYDETCLDIIQGSNGELSVKGLKECDTWVGVNAFLGSVQLTGCNFHVVVKNQTSAPESSVELTGIRVEPSEIDIIQGQAVRISTSSASDENQPVICPYPSTAEFHAEDFMYSYQNWGSYNISVTDDGVIKGLQVGGPVTVCITARSTKLGVTYECDLKVNVKNNPFRLKSFTLKELRLREGETGVLEKQINPTDADISDVTFSYTIQDTSIAEISSDGVVTAKKPGTVWVSAKAVDSFGTITEGVTCAIIVEEKTPKLYVNGSKFATTDWDILRDCIKEQSESPDTQALPLSGVFPSQNGFYVLKKNAQLQWKPEYEKLSFDEYLEKDSNKDQFILIQPGAITWSGNSYSGGLGTILGKDGKYYVCVQSIDNTNTWEWDDTYIAEHFIVLSPC